ncbi:MAG TPA: prolyl oligopeptidase family serine peptidase [Fimbriiglobus sp.]|jgi:dipeptidyl aminopeptidase/acylaminoacyl peptidase
MPPIRFARAVLIVVVSSLVLATSAPAQRRGGGTPIPKATLTPHWLAGDTKFWYRNSLKRGTKEFVLVDAEKGTKGPAFDHAKLAAGLSRAAEKSFTGDKLPFDVITFEPDLKTVRFELSGKEWRCDLWTYECSLVVPSKQKSSDRQAVNEDASADDDAPFFEPEPQRGGRRGGGGIVPRDLPSPDGKWIAFVKDGNVNVRPKAGGDAVKLSTTGAEANTFGMLSWSRDGKAVVAFRIEPGDNKEVYLVQSSPPGGGRAVLQSRPYPLPGDKFTAYEPWVFDPAEKTATKLDVDRSDFGRPAVRWRKDGRHFTYEKVDRGHQRFRLIEVDSHTGKTRNLIDEKTNTFIWTAHAEAVGMPLVTWLTKTDELLYSSEKSGWRHLHLIDANTGQEKNDVTPGNFVVRGIDKIDEANRQLWFRGAGRDDGQDPYFVHYYRVNFDGTGLVALTPGNGTHTAQFSPMRKYLVDSFSRVDLPPEHELRSAADGKLICQLEKADVSDVRSTPPEVFVAKGRDGTTDIWGIICRPRNFDPTKKYPVIESIYAGPQGSPQGMAFTPKSYSANSRFRNLTDLGFVVVQMDGMGTAGRSKAFHDVCWKNLADAGFPDRILWHTAAAAKYPWYDATRVGIYGTSAGGQNAAGAVIFHGDFYKAAYAACGCHDNRMDKASWNEQWMGYPVGPQYSASSNIDNARKLTGKLFLVVGEMDHNVPPESTLRLVDALIKANKEFEFLMIPGMDHSNGGPYGTRRMLQFFVKHLMPN